MFIYLSYKIVRKNDDETVTTKLHQFHVSVAAYMVSGHAQNIPEKRQPIAACLPSSLNASFCGFVGNGNVELVGTLEPLISVQFFIENMNVVCIRSLAKRQKTP